MRERKEKGGGTEGREMWCVDSGVYWNIIEHVRKKINKTIVVGLKPIMRTNDQKENDK